MRLDVRLAIGALFSILGAFLASFGIASDKALYERSLGVNINLEWGLVMLGFGLIMAVLGRDRSRADVEPRTAAKDGSAGEREKTLRPGKQA